MGRVATGRASSVKPSQMFSMRVVSDFIPDRSQPEITATVTSDWAPRATGGHAIGCKEKVESNGEERSKTKQECTTSESN